MIEETNRNVQLTMATQSLQSRLTAAERSANALRQILRQKFGDQGVLHMMEALEKLGAGSNALLEVAVSGAAEVMSADVLDRAPYSYETKHPDTPPGSVPTVSAAIPSSSYYLQQHAGAGEAPGSQRSQNPYAGSAHTGGPTSTKSHKAGSLFAAPNDGVTENPYAKAIEGAMYGRK
jgi:hypothetical protein